MQDRYGAWEEKSVQERQIERNELLCMLCICDEYIKIHTHIYAYTPVI